MRGDERTQDGIGDLTSVPGGPSAGTRNSGFTRGPLNRVPPNDAVIDAAAERWGKRQCRYTRCSLAIWTPGVRPHATVAKAERMVAHGEVSREPNRPNRPSFQTSA
jgi:hypothetical protein